MSAFPSDLEKLTSSDVGRVLVTLNLRRHVTIFSTNQIDGALLKGLGADELRVIGMNAFEVNKLRRFIAGWRPK